MRGQDEAWHLLAPILVWCARPHSPPGAAAAATANTVITWDDRSKQSRPCNSILGNISIRVSREGESSATGGADMHSTSQPPFGFLEFEMSLVGQFTTTGVILSDTAVCD